MPKWSEGTAIAAEAAPFTAAHSDCCSVPDFDYFLTFVGYVFFIFWVWGAVNKSAASAASLDYVKFQAVTKSAASAASLRGGRASSRLDHGIFFVTFGRASGQKMTKNSQNLGL